MEDEEWMALDAAEIRDLKEENERLQADNKRLREALRSYIAAAREALTAKTRPDADSTQSRSD
jgi:regulator of replication initiation timing